MPIRISRRERCSIGSDRTSGAGPTRLPIDEAQSEGLSTDTGESVQHRPARRCGLFLHCTGQPHIVIEHKTGGRRQDWYDPWRSAVAKCRLLFLVRWEARLS
jgi:hypothetical protein